MKAAQPDASPLIELINERLFYGAMPEALQAEVKAAVETIRLKATPTVADGEVITRLRSALLLAVASPEFQVQR